MTTPPTRWCDFDRLAATITRQFHGGAHSIHGPSHWRRVEHNALQLARCTGADVLVVRLFAWFHDARRINDGTDPGHGRRGAVYAAELRGSLFDLEDAGFEALTYACTWHTDKIHSADPTIGTCWDADRLDLGRVGMTPSAKFMSTDFAKAVAHAGSFEPFLKDLGEDPPELDDPFDLDRFVVAQEEEYETALAELRAGQKETHWIWYVLPQLRALGHSEDAQFYGIAGLAEATAYWQHPVLGPRLRACVQAMLQVEGRSAVAILGDIDAMKFRSCLTLFLAVAPADSTLQAALARFYDGKPDAMTLRLLRE